MREASESRTLLADTLDIVQWLQADRDTPYAERLRRDRAIATGIAANEPLERVREWWRHVLGQPGFVVESRATVVQLERWKRWITLLMLIVGIGAGATAAGAVLRYDGTWPVNVVTVMATLVLLQIVLITLSVLLMLPRFPGLALVQDLLTDINPAALIASISRRFRRDPAGFDSPFDFQGARGPASARLARWQILVWSQLAAVAFNVAAIVTLAALVAFTDLAFGWSTTLQLTGDEALRITDAISSPWRGFWMDAVPSAALIEQSRYFRLADARHVIASAAALTGWWPFLLASILFYGLLPRCLMLAFASFRLRAATRGFLLDDPQVHALLDRMKLGRVDLGAAGIAEEAAHADSLSAQAAPLSRTPAAVIIWSSTMPSHTVAAWVNEHLSWRVTEILNAGGASSIANDEAIVERVVLEKPAAVLILVRAWEAPLLDLRDFLSLLRTRVGRTCSMIVVPIGPEGTAATDTQRTTWSRWTGAIADPALYLETGS